MNSHNNPQLDFVCVCSQLQGPGFWPCSYWALLLFLLQMWCAACWGPHSLHRWHEHRALLLIRGHPTSSSHFRKCQARDITCSPKQAAFEASRNRCVLCADTTSCPQYSLEDHAEVLAAVRCCQLTPKRDICVGVGGKCFDASSNHMHFSSRMWTGKKVTSVFE